MNLRYRRILYLIFIGLFLVIVPVLILYTAGYRYNFKRHKIERTGILYIDSKPKGALIYLNDNYKDKTPRRFARLLPDTYQVRVEKEGYFSWQKELTVKSNLTTFAKNIILFKKNLPINITEGEINIFAISPNQEKIIYSIIKQNTEELRLMNLKNQSDFLIKQLNNRIYNQLEFIEWSPSQNKALFKEIIGDFNKYLIVDIKTLKTKELFDITRLNFSDVGWDINSDNYLYALRQAVLYQIDLVNNSTRSLLSANISDFQVRQNIIYYITKVATESFLNKSVLTDQKISETQKIKLPSPSQYTLQSSTANYLVLLDKKNNDLFIINSESFAEADISRNIILQDKAKKIVWSKDSKNLLYYTDFEISTFNFSSKEKNLITRYGEIIREAFWYPGDNYIIYQVNDTIRAIEDTATEIKNDVKLTELSKINSITIDSDGKNLYLQGKAGTQQGIYKLEIQ